MTPENEIPQSSAPLSCPRADTHRKLQAHHHPKNPRLTLNPASDLGFRGLGFREAMGFRGLWVEGFRV